MKKFYKGSVDIRFHKHAMSHEEVAARFTEDLKLKELREEIRWMAEENLRLERVVEQLEEESILGFLKRKVKKWTHLKS